MSNAKSNVDFFKRLKPIVYNDQNIHGSEIITLSINDPGTILVNSRTDKSLRIWKCSQDGLYDPITVEKAHEKPVESIAWNPMTEYTFATVGRDEYVKIWRGINGKLDQSIKVTKSNDVPVACQKVSYSYDGKILAVVDREFTVIFLSVETKYKNIGEAKLSEYINSLDWFHFNHDFFIAGLHDGTACIFETKLLPNKQLQVLLRHKLTGHKSSITSTVIDPRGTYIGLGSNEGVVSLWSTKNFVVDRLITNVDEPIHCLNCSRDGAYVGITFEKGTAIKVYDTTSVQEMLDITNSASGKSVDPIIAWFPNKTAFVFTSDKCTTMTYMTKP